MDDWRNEMHTTAMKYPESQTPKIYPVSNLVNSSKKDDSHGIDSVRIARHVFERQWWGDSLKIETRKSIVRRTAVPSPERMADKLLVEMLNY
jgi:hypothetical protein